MAKTWTELELKTDLKIKTNWKCEWKRVTLLVMCVCVCAARWLRSTALTHRCVSGPGVDAGRAERWTGGVSAGRLRRVSVCVCVCERESVCVCVCVMSRSPQCSDSSSHTNHLNRFPERERKCVCVCVRDGERLVCSIVSALSVIYCLCASTHTHTHTHTHTRHLQRQQWYHVADHVIWKHVFWKYLLHLIRNTVKLWNIIVM